MDGELGMIAQRCETSPPDTSSLKHFMSAGGLAKERKRDLDGALADYNQAIQRS
jgi:hypothetical protein